MIVRLWICIAMWATAAAWQGFAPHHTIVGGVLGVLGAVGALVCAAEEHLRG